MVVSMLMSGAHAAGLLTVEELAERLAAETAPVIIDVRGEAPYLSGHIPSAVMIPHDHIGKHVDLLYDRKKEPMVLYGETERGARLAANTLEDAGFKRVMILVGGFRAWRAAGGALTHPPRTTPVPDADNAATTASPPPPNTIE
jgi:rhodanese-related sulfurtransferase